MITIGFPVRAAAALVLASLPGLPAVAADRPGEPANTGMKPEAQRESDWVDQRWNQTDVGPFLASTLNLPGARITRGLSVKVGASQEGTMAYDTATASWRASWVGGFLRFDPARYGLIHPPSVQGTIVAQAPAPPDRQPRPRFGGLSLHGPRVILRWQLGSSRILESPWLLTNSGLTIFTRSLQVPVLDQPFRIPLAAAAEPADIREDRGGWNAVVQQGSHAVAFRVVAPGGRVVQADRTLFCEMSADRSSPGRSVQIAFCDASTGLASTLATLARSLQDSRGDLDRLQDAGPSRWLPESVTRGQRGLDLDILAVDTLTVPYDNPWKALLFLAGVDFTPDGTAYVCTIHGDVWRVQGIDNSLRDLRWHRFATGLFQPLGLKVRDGRVHVLGRDQITRLSDLNGDGEADVYECFSENPQASAGGHDYVTCLEQDNAGNFYYVDPHGLHRVSADGQTRTTIATGWRNPNGMGVSPDGTILTVAPQQGEWTPSSQISEARPGGFYGYGGPRLSPGRPLGYDAPLCWIPHSVDNSSGSQVWVPPGQWGPLGGHMLHLLWGRCGLMLVLRDEVHGMAQGAAVPLPGRFLSGPNRGSFNPHDGHLYVAGSTGWQTAAVKDGALQRVRFTGRPVQLPIAWHAHSNGLSVTFTVPLERAAAEDPGSYAVRQWNYRYAAAYGSKDWSVTDPSREGRDELPVRRARLLPDGHTVFVELPPLAPVMQMEVKYSLNTAAGKALRSQFWLTLNALDQPGAPAAAPENRVEKKR